MLLYTPPYSRRAMGTVTLKQRPGSPVRPDRYRFLLELRLQRLMEKADPHYLEDVLGRLETQENLRLIGKPNPAEILVDCSQTLREMAAYPCDPIPPEAWKPDPETEEALSLECAVEYLEMLVR